MKCVALTKEDIVEQSTLHYEQSEAHEAHTSPQSTIVGKDWTLAALAHATVLITLVLSTAGGAGILIGPAIALAMYWGYREKSHFVAFHALQSCVYQVAGILIYGALIALLTTIIAVAWGVSGMLSVILIGLLLMPLALLITVAGTGIITVAPLVWTGYGLYAAYRVYQGDNFIYPTIGTELKRRISQ